MEVFLRGVYDTEEIPESWLWKRMRIQRDKLLSACDWTQVADAPTDKQAWANYRQTLRDFPETWAPSEVVVFPDSPVAEEPPTDNEA